MFELSKAIACALLLVPATAALCLGQVTQTGIIAGSVVDPDGNPVAAARVVVTGSRLFVPRVETVADLDGLFRIPGLPPGRYTVSADASWLQASGRSELSIRVGEIAQVRITLSSSAEQSPGRRIGLRADDFSDLFSKALRHKLGRDTLRTLPTDFSLNGLLALEHGTNYIDFQPAVRGSDVRSNTVHLDGLNLNRPDTGLPILRPIFEQMSSLELDSGAHDVRLSQASGGTFNIISVEPDRSLSLEASFFSRLPSLSWSGRSEDRLDESSYRGAVVLGGLLESIDGWFDAAVQAQRDRWRWPAKRLAPETDRGLTLHARLAGSLGEGSGYVASVLHESLDRRAAVAPNTTLWIVQEPGIESITSDRNDQTTLLRIDLDHNLSEAVSMDFTGMLSWTDSTAKPSGGSTDRISRIDPGARIVLSGPYDPLWTDSSLSRALLRGSFEYYMDELAGTHNIALGMEFEGAQKDSRFGYSGGHLITYYQGTPVYRTSIRDAAGSELSAISRQSLSRFGLFAHDSWSPLPQLVVDFAVRYDGPVVENSSTRIVDWDDVGARITFSFDPFGSGDTAVRLGYARYYSAALLDQIPGDPYMVVQQFNQATLDEMGIIAGPAAGGWGSELDATTRRGYDEGWSTVDFDTHAPISDEFIVALEQRLSSNLWLALRYFRRNWSDLLEDIETNLTDSYSRAWALDSAGLAYPYWIRQPGADGTCDPALVWQNDEELRRRHEAVELEVRASLSWLTLRAAYTWSVTEGNIDVDLEGSSASARWGDDPAARHNSFGYLSSDRRHQLRGLLTAAPAGGFSLGVFFCYSTGAPFNRLLLNRDIYSLRYEILGSARGARYRLDDSFLVDLRLEKSFALDSARLSLVLDVFNVLNDNSVTAVDPFDTAAFGAAAQSLKPRRMQLGFRFSF